jgi:hypothetical protein
LSTGHDLAKPNRCMTLPAALLPSMLQHRVNDEQCVQSMHSFGGDTLQHSTAVLHRKTQAPQTSKRTQTTTAVEHQPLPSPPYTLVCPAVYMCVRAAGHGPVRSCDSASKRL